jgi:RNA polymerase sigma factor (sigma-70 family)
MSGSLRVGAVASDRAEGRRRFAAIEQALEALLPFLRRFTHARLPQYARRRMDTGDLVQEAVVGVLRNLGEIHLADPDALRRYLVVAIQHRICDEVRRAGLGEVTNGSPAGAAAADARPSPHDDAVEDEYQRQYREALLRLREDERQLLVGRIELSLSYEELAIATGRPNAEAARNAARRAALRLARLMGRPAPESATDLRPGSRRD